MPNDLDGSRYRRLINNANSSAATNDAVSRALQDIALVLHSGGTTESTVAVGYWRQRIFIAKLGRVNPPEDMVTKIANIIFESDFGEVDMDDVTDMENAVDVFDPNGANPVKKIVGVGGGRTGLHAEMMLLQEYSQKSAVTAWDAQILPNIYIAASQGACPGCAGYMNFKSVRHTGVRTNGRCSSRWFNPFDQTFCGTEVNGALSFPNIRVIANARWIGVGG